MTDFAAVDTGDPRDLVAMMDATDAWPAVQASRAWLLDQVTLHDGDLVVDAGCGPGTFGAEVPGSVIDVDASHVMLRETRVRRPDARVVLGDVADLPLRDGTAAFVHAERVLQWIGDPGRALGELHRVVAPGGWLGVTDTDWGTFRIDHPDPGAADRLAGAALGWVPHARVARDLPTLFTALGARDVPPVTTSSRSPRGIPTIPRSAMVRPVSRCTRSRVSTRRTSTRSPMRRAGVRSAPRSRSSPSSVAGRRHRPSRSTRCAPVAWTA